MTRIHGFAVQDTFITPGEYTLVETTAPAGFRVGSRRAIEVVEGQTLEVTVQQQTGGRFVRVAQLDESGSPVSGACVQLSREGALGQPGEVVAHACDAYDGEDGMTAIGGVPAGNYILLSASAPPDHTQVREAGYQTVNVRRDRDAEATLSYAPSGMGIIRAVEENGQPVIGLCFGLEAEDGYGYGCDRFDAEGDDGVTHVPNVRAGDNEVAPQPLPRGYRAPSEPPVLTIVPGDPAAEVTIELRSGGQGVVITNVAPDGSPALGGCANLYAEGSGPFEGDVLASGCDFDGAEDDGTIFISVEPGDYVLNSRFRQFPPPPDQPVTVRRDRETEVTINHEPGGALTVSLVDADGAPLAGGCFVVAGPADDVPYRNVGSGCDSYDAGNNGTTTVSGLPAGDWMLIPVDLPRGHALPAAEPVAIEAEGETTVTLEAEEGGLTVDVLAVDADEDRVDGLCFHVFAATTSGGQGDLVTWVCDDFDVRSDGRTRINGMAAGDYQLLQFRAPEGYDLATEPALFTAAEGEDVEVTFVVPAAPEDDES